MTMAPFVSLYDTGYKAFRRAKNHVNNRRTIHIIAPKCILQDIDKKFEYSSSDFEIMIDQTPRLHERNMTHYYRVFFSSNI